MNHFVLPASEYKRDLNIVKAWITQQSTLLHKATGEPYAKCVEYVKKEIKPGGKFEIKDPQVISLEQKTHGNRTKCEDRTFLDYVKEVVETDRILSPSMVCYERPEVNKSTSAAFIEGGINERKVAKNEMFVARQNEDFVLEYIKDCEQNAKKIGINSVSGMHGFSGNILYVKSGHSSLTSMCRTATGYGNANNERFITGSRHYWSADIALANISTIITNTDFELLAKCIEAYGIKIPNVDDTMACIHRSTSLYWRNDEAMAEIKEVVKGLTDMDRCAVVYSGDLYHLMVFNEQLVRGFMDEIIKPAAPITEEQFEAVLKRLDGDQSMLINYLNADLFVGDIRNTKVLKAKNPEGYQRLLSTAANLHVVLDKYELLIKALWVPKHMPPTVANIKSIIRRTALASDTDSTIFTTQEWVKWYTGSYKRTKEGDGIWYTMTYLTTQCIIHVLAQFSANMGVSKSDLHRLSMKNEYAFPVFSLTARAKHYFAFMSAREGNVYEEYDSEIKGVALRSSAVPVHVIKRAKELMLEIMHAADKGEQLSLKYVYHVVWEFENDIRTSIERGEAKYLKTGQIKEKYKDEASSPLQHYYMWEQVFAPTYGSCPAPPYSVIKVPLDINNKTDMADWLKQVETMDAGIASRMKDFLISRNRTNITTLQLPSAVLGDKGMPKEVMPVVNIRKLTYEILESFYMLLECLGVMQIDSNFNRLVSDVYTPDEAMLSEGTPNVEAK